MRRPDDELLDPGVAETLAAIDATLDGEAVAPEHAAIAELALLLAAEKPRPEAAFAADLDERVQLRFGGRDAGASGAAFATTSGSSTPRWRMWMRSPAFGVAGAGLAAVAVAIVIVTGEGNKGPTLHQPVPVLRGVAQPATGATGATGAAGAAGVASGGASGTTSGGDQALVGPTPNDLKAQAPAAAVAPSSSASAGTQSVVPPSGNRQTIQSAQLTLGAPPNRIEQVSQEAFRVVSSVGGIVDSSSITQTGGADGSAFMQLRVPVSALQRTMSQLSELSGAHVVSRTDNLQDVNNQFVDANRALADAKALRAKLLSQLAKATSQTQIDSLKAQIKSTDATIAALEARLRGLSRAVSFSRIQLTIQASGTAVVSSGGGFGLHRALHDALRVLTVGAGVALIALAVLVPITLLGALAWWIGALARRRRREHALDVAI